MSYAPHDTLIAPARPSAQLWRLGLGIVVAIVVMFGLTRALFGAVHFILGEDAYWSLLTLLQTASTPFGLLILLFSMGFMAIGVLVAMQMVHRRGVLQLIGPLALAWRQFRRVTVALVLLYALVMLLPPWSYAGETQPGLAFGTWLSLLPLTVLGLLIQTGSEELLFRGYIQSQLAARLRHPLVWLTLPSALFALGHYAPGVYGPNAPLIALWAFVFGVLAADLTARSGTLGPALALHFVNNFVAIAITSMQGDMSGLALSKLPFGSDDIEAVRALLPLDLAMLIVSWLAARVALRL
ncbi:MAG: type II CAAX endopeptidase family protein [Paracoccaceae bacterium]|nr:type II CAAX endopeptidase family protein [Paracoccaceae bacterium]